MKFIFVKKTYKKFRIFLVIVLFFILIVCDSKMDSFYKVRFFLNSTISCFYFIYKKVFFSLDKLFFSFFMVDNLIMENFFLKEKLLLSNNEQLLLESYKDENNKLRNLLDLSVRSNSKKIIAEVIYFSDNCDINKIIINKGNNSGVYVGQVAMDDNGIVGQVISVSKFTSTVLLICDSSHALPVKVLRSGVRTILYGNGCDKELYTNDFLLNSDIKVGDLLVSSGIDGRFPEGYPVAIVSSVKFNKKKPFFIIKAKSIFCLNCLCFVLLNVD